MMGWRYKAGLFLIGAVVIIWVTSAEVTQGIYTDYKQPFAVTYLGASLMVVYLPIAFLKDWLCNLMRKQSPRITKSSSELDSHSLVIQNGIQKMLEMESQNSITRKDSDLDISEKEDEKPFIANYKEQIDSEGLKRKKSPTTREIVKYGFYLAPLWFFTEIFVKGKDLWGHIDGSNPAPDKNKDKNEHANWEVKDAQVMSWILGSVEYNIVLNLRPFNTATEMWDYLKKIYNQHNTARRFQLEHELAILQHDSLSISDFYSSFMNLWAEYSDIIYAALPPEGLSSVQAAHETMKRDQNLMKLRSEFEGTKSNLVNREPVPALDACLSALFREEQLLLTQTTMEQQISTYVHVAYATGRPKGKDFSNIKCFCCNRFGHYSSNCSKKVCSYCKKDGHIVKECLIQPLRRFEIAYNASVGSSSTGYVNAQQLKQSAVVQPVTPEMIQQMIISAFSALGLSGSAVGEDDRKGA